MPDQTATPRLRPHRHIRATLTEQGGMLLDLRGHGRWFVLTPSAALWWDRIQRGGSFAEATDAIAERYNLTRQQVDHDLRPFIDELTRRGFLVPVKPGTARWWRRW